MLIVKLLFCEQLSTEVDARGWQWGKNGSLTYENIQLLLKRIIILALLLFSCWLTWVEYVINAIKVIK